MTMRLCLRRCSPVWPMQILSAFKCSIIAKGWPISTGPYGVGESNDQIHQLRSAPDLVGVETGFVAKYPDVWRITIHGLHQRHHRSPEADQQRNRSPAGPAPVRGRQHPGPGRSPHHLDRPQTALRLSGLVADLGAVLHHRNHPSTTRRCAGRLLMPSTSRRWWISAGAALVQLPMAHSPTIPSWLP